MRVFQRPLLTSCNVEVVPHDRAVAPDFNWLISQHLAEEDRNGALGAVGPLALAIWIRDAHHRVLESVQIMEEVQVFFDGEFVNAVGADRVRRVRFRDWNLLRRSVDGAAGGDEDDFFDNPILLARIQEVDCRDCHVRRKIKRHVIIGGLRQGCRDQVVNDIDAARGVVDDRVISEISLDEFILGEQVLNVGFHRFEAIEKAEAVALRDELIGNVRSEKPSATKDETFHTVIPPARISVELEARRAFGFPRKSVPGHRHTRGMLFGIFVLGCERSDERPIECHPFQVLRELHGVFTFSNSNPFTLWVTASDIPPRLVATTGHPEAIDE